MENENRKRVLVVDDLAIFREPIALTLESNGYDVVSAKNGADALSLIGVHRKKFDLLIVDYNMPEVDGLEFLSHAYCLEHMRSTPSLMLTDTADKQVVLQAVKIGVSDYMLKSSFSIPELMNKVKKCLDETITTPILERRVGRSSKPGEIRSSKSYLQTIAEFVRGNPISSYAYDLICSSRFERNHSMELSDLIEIDPVLSFRVLKVANSPMFRRSDNAIYSVKEAVTRIGSSGVRSLVGSSAVISSGKGEGESWYLRLILHSYSIAQALEEFCKGSDLAQISRMVGLCHDFPELIFGLALRDKYLEIVRDTAGEPDKFQTRVAKTCGLATYAEFVEFVCRTCEFPDFLSEPILYLQQSTTIDSAKKFEQLSVCMRQAHQLVNALGYHSESHSMLDSAGSEEIRLAGWNEGARMNISPMLISNIDQFLGDCQVFERSSIHQEIIPKKALYLNYSFNLSTGTDPILLWLKHNTYLLRAKSAPETQLGLADFVLWAVTDPDFSSDMLGSRYDKLIAAIEASGVPIICLASKNSVQAVSKLLKSAVVLPLPVSMKMLRDVVNRSVSKN